MPITHRESRTWVLCLLISLLSGCAGFLEQEPGNQTSIEEQLSDYAGFQAALNGTYSSLEALMRSEAFVVYADLQSGNLSFTPSQLGSRRGQVTVPTAVENVYGFQDLAFDSDLSSFYGNAYTVIAEANYLIARSDSIPDATAPEIDMLQAEALAIRSLAHFLLLQLYGQHYGFTPDASHPGIAYVAAPIPIGGPYPARASVGGGPYPARASVGEVYAALIDDLEEALSLSRAEPTLPGPGYTYFTPLAMRALLARVQLYAERWADAAATATTVIEEGGLSLMSGEDYAAQWRQPLSPVSEIILELSPPVDGEGNLGGSVSAFFDYTSTNEYGDYVASGDLIAAFTAGDVRLDSMFEVQEILTLDEQGEFPRPYFFTEKLQGPAGIPVLRLSEMYLIRAEALARSGDLVADLADLNALRERAGLAPVDASVDLLAEILLERRREFCFEGQYLYDLARYQRDLVRGQGCIAQVCDLSYPSPFLILPIPQRNLDLNGNLEQNEGYN